MQLKQRFNTHIAIRENAVICLSLAEANAWLSHSGMSISSSRDVSVSRSVGNVRKSFFAHLPIEGIKLAYLSNAIVDWLPGNGELLLWIKNWEVTPHFEIHFFESIRTQYTAASLIEAPGQVFSIAKTGRSEDLERSLLIGFLLLIICYDWEAYLVSNDNADYIFISDEHVLFSTTSDGRANSALSIFEKFEMKPKIGPAEQ